MATANRTNGVRSETRDYMVVDAGAVYKNWGADGSGATLIGATQGGATWVVEQTIRQPEIDGIPGPVAGTRRITNVMARLRFAFLEMTKENLRMALVGATGDPIRRDQYVIGQSEHIGDLALVATLSGSADSIVFKVLNGIVDSEELSMSTEDGSEASPEIQVTAHYDPTNLTGSEPWEIIVPTV